MKLFNWRHKNLRQTPGQAFIHLIFGGSSATDAGKRQPQVCGDDVNSHVTNGSLKHAIQATWPQTAEQCWEAEKAADLYYRIQSKLLAIGTLGLIGLEDDAERETGVGDQWPGIGRNVETSANMVQLQEQVLVMQNELEKAFSISNASEESNMSQQRYHIICDGGVGFDNDKLIDPFNGRVGKVKKVFPEKKPIETPFEAVNKKITHASFMLESSLSRSKSVAFEDIKKQRNRAADSLKRLFSITRSHLFRALFKSKRTPEQSPLDLSHPSKLKKLLDPILQKRRAMSSRPPRQLTEPITLADNDSDSCCNDIDTPLLSFPALAARSTGCTSITDNAPEEFESSSDAGDSDLLRTLEELLASGSSRDNEYWVNTDDEYVVLEL